MALTNVTTTFNLSDYIGGNYDPRRTKVYLTTNAEKNRISDTSTGEIRLGGGTVTLGADGAVSATTWAPGVDANPASWQTTFHIDYVDSATRQRQTVAVGPFTITTSGLLTALDVEQTVPATYLTTVTELLDTYTDTAAASATSAAASASSAASSADLAADVAKPIDTAAATALAPGATPTVTITGTNPSRTLNLGIPAGVADDASMAAQVGTGGAFDSALTASIDARIEESGAAVDAVVRATIGTGTYTLDPATTGTLILTLTGDATLAFGAGLVDGQSFTVRVVQDATGGRTLTLPDATGTVTLTETANTYETLVFQYLNGLGLIVHQAANGPYEVPWSPASMTDLRGWWIATDIPGDPGSTITTWPNRADENDLTVPGGVTAPTLTFVNGEPVVTFTGTEYLETAWANGPYAQPMTYAFLVKQESTAANMGVLGGNNTASDHQVWRGNTPNPNRWIANAGAALTSTVDDDNALTILTATFNGAASTLRVDGVSTAGNPGTDAVSAIRLGRTTTLGTSMSGYIAAAVVVGHAVAGAELTELETYLAGIRDRILGV